jgi:predicted transcriptional regulator
MRDPIEEIKTPDDILDQVAARFGEDRYSVLMSDRTRRMSNIRHEIIKKLYESGYTINIICKTVGRSRSTVLYSLGHLSRCPVMRTPRLDPKKSRAGWKMKKE